MTERPFKVLGIQQVAVGGLDKVRLRTLWVDTLGLELAGGRGEAHVLSRSADRLLLTLRLPAGTERAERAS